MSKMMDAAGKKPGEPGYDESTVRPIPPAENVGNGASGGNQPQTTSNDSALQEVIAKLQVMSGYVQAKNIKEEQEATLEGSKTVVRDAVNELLNKMQNLNLDTATKQTLSERISEIATTFDLVSPAPARLTDARMMAMDKARDDKGVVSKLVSRIPKFSGEKEDYKWETFLTCYSMAVANANYSPSELRSIFLQCLEGSALIHYSANEADYGTLPYEDLIRRFEARYGEKLRDSIDAMMAIEQGVNEKVLAYRDRLMNSSKRFLPVKPSKVYLLKSTEEEKMFVDSQYNKKMAEYHLKLERDMIFVTRTFVAGLRDEILDRMNTTEFETLDEAVKAAEIAEDYIQFRTRARSNHIQVQSNAVGSSFRKTNPRSRSSSRDGRNGRSKDACHKCGQSGHWASSCPNSTRRTDPPPGDDLRAMVRNLSSKIEVLERNVSDRSRQKTHRTDSLKKKKGSRKMASRSRSRGSQGTSGYRSRSSSIRSRSQSRTRSSSKNGRQW